MTNVVSDHAPAPRKRLMYIATRWPWPIATGRQRMIDQSLRFAVEGGWQVTLLYAGRRAADPATCPLPDIEHHLLPMPKLPEAAVNLAVLGGRPLQDAFFGSRAAHDQVSATIETFDPDTIVVDMLRMAQFVEKLPTKPRGKLVLDMDDVLSLRYRRMREAGTGNVLGAFSERMPKPVRVAADVIPK
ncbi:glycosyl transferase, partial [Methylobacterium brachiatum]